MAAVPPFDSDAIAEENSDINNQINQLAFNDRILPQNPSIEQMAMALNDNPQSEKLKEEIKEQASHPAVLAQVFRESERLRGHSGDLANFGRPTSNKNKNITVPNTPEETVDMAIIREGINEFGDISPKLEAQMNNNPRLRNLYETKVREGESFKPTVEDPMTVAPSSTGSVQAGTPVDTKADNANKALANKKAKKGVQTTVPQNRKPLTGTEKQQLRNASSLEEAGKILKGDSSYFHNDVEAKAIWKASQKEKENFVTEQENLELDAEARGRELARRANDFSATGSLEEMNAASIELAQLRADALEGVDFSGSSSLRGEGVWDNQFLADLVTGGVELGSSAQNLPFFIVQKLKEGSLTEQGINGINALKFNENKRAELREEYRKFLKAAEEGGAGKQELDDRAEIYQQQLLNLEAADKAIEDHVNSIGLGDRLRDLGQERIDAAQATADAFSAEGRGFFKATKEIGGALLNQAGLNAATLPELAMVGLNAALGTSDLDLAQDVKNLSGFINENQGKISVGDTTLDAEGIQDPRIRAQFESDLETSWEASEPLRNEYNEAVKNNDDIAAAAAAGKLIGELGWEVGKAFINNPRAAASLATEEGVQFVIGTPLRGFAKIRSGKGSFSIKKDTDKKIANIEETFKKREADLAADHKGKLDALTAAAKGAAAPGAGVKLQKGFRSDEAKLKADFRKESNQIKKDQKAAIKTAESADSLGKTLSDSAVLIESAGQGMNIYNQALQDYMTKTDGLLPTKEEARTMMSAAMLAGATDFLSDKLIGSSSGLLSKMAKSSKATKAAPKGAKDTVLSQATDTAKTILNENKMTQIAKGLANRAIKSRGVASTLEKGAKVGRVTELSTRPVRPGAKFVGASGVEAATEGVQTDLEINLANYLLGEEREAGSGLEVFMAAAQGAVASGTLLAPSAVAQTAAPVAQAAVATGKAAFRTLDDTGVGDAIKNTIDPTGKRGLGEGKTQIYDTNNIVESVNNFDLSNKDNMQAVIDDVQSLATQTDKAMSQLGEGDKATKDKILGNLQAVSDEIMAKANQAEKVEDETNVSQAELIRDLVAKRRKVRDIQNKHKGEAAKNDKSDSIIKQFDDQKAAGVEEKSIVINSDDITGTTLFFGSSPSGFGSNPNNKKEQAKVKKLLDIAKVTGNSELAANIVSRIDQARKEGALNKRAGSQPEKRNVKQTRESLKKGDDSFVGLEEYEAFVDTLAGAVTNDSNADTTKMRSVYKKITDGIENLQEHQRKKFIAVETAKNSYDPATKQISAEALSLLQDVGLNFNFGIKGLNTLSGEINKDFTAIAATAAKVTALQQTITGVAVDQAKVEQNRNEQKKVVKQQIQEPVVAKDAPKEQPAKQVETESVSAATEVSAPAESSGTTGEVDTTETPEDIEQLKREAQGERSAAENVFDELAEDDDDTEEPPAPPASAPQIAEADPLDEEVDPNAETFSLDSSAYSLLPEPAPLSEGLLGEDGLPVERLSKEEAKAIQDADRKKRGQKPFPEIFESAYINFVQKYFKPSGKSLLSPLSKIIMDNLVAQKVVNYVSGIREETFVVGVVQEMYPRVVAALDISTQDKVINLEKNFSAALQAENDKDLKSKKNIIKDPLQFVIGKDDNYLRSLLNKDGAFPEEVIQAVTLAVSQWLIANPNINNQWAEDLTKSFGLDYDKAGHRLPAEITEKYRYIGRRDDQVVKDIGRIAFSILSLDPKDPNNDPENFKQNIEVLLGTLGMHVLRESPDFIKVTPIPRSVFIQDKNQARNFNDDTGSLAAETMIEGQLTSNAGQQELSVSWINHEDSDMLRQQQKELRAIREKLAGSSKNKKEVALIDFDLDSIQNELAILNSKGDRLFFAFKLPTSSKTIREQRPLLEKVLGFVPLVPELMTKEKLENRPKEQRELLEAHRDKENNKRPKGAQYIFDKLFFNSDNQRMPKLKSKATKYGTRKHNSSTVMPEALADDLNKHNETPYIVNTDLVDLFSKYFFDNSDVESKKNFLRLLGVVEIADIDHLIAAEKETQEGKNSQIMSDLDKFSIFLENMDELGINLADQEMFLDTELQSNNRLQFAKAAINPLLSKIHRSLFPLSNKKEGKDFFRRKTSTALDSNESFDRKVAVLQKLDLAGDTDSSIKIMETFNDLMNGNIKGNSEPKTISKPVVRNGKNEFITLPNPKYRPTFADALAAFKALDEDNTSISQNTWDTLQTFLDKADHPTAALEVLRDEVNREAAEAAGESEYETHLVVSMDGISSGLALSIYFLSGTDPAVDNVAKMMGVFTENTDEQSLKEIGDKDESDGYEIVAINFLNEIKALARPKPPKEPDNVARAVLGILTKANGFSFDDNGHLPTDKDTRKKVRKLMKHDVLAKVFGRGAAGVEAGIRDWLIDGAHKIVNDSIIEVRNGTMTVDQQITQINDLNARFNVLTNLREPRVYIDVNNLDKLNLKTGSLSRDLKIKPQLEGQEAIPTRLNALANIFDASADRVLFDFSQNRDSINGAYNVQFSMYETLRNILMAQKLAEYAAANPNTFDPSRMQLPKKIRLEVENELYKILPKVKTPHADGKSDINDEMALSNLEPTDSNRQADRITIGKLGYPRRMIAPSFKAVGATIKVIHAVEASIAAKAATLSRVLSTHDAHSTHLDNAKRHNELLNQTMLETIEGFELMETVMGGISDAYPIMKGMLVENIDSLTNLDYQRMYQPLEQVLFAWKKSKDKDFKFSQMPSKRFANPSTQAEADVVHKKIFSVNLKEFESFLAEQKTKKTKMSSLITKLSHYAYPDSGFDTSRAVKEKVAKEELTKVEPIVEPTDERTITRNDFMSKLFDGRRKDLGLLREQMNLGISGAEALDNLTKLKGRISREMHNLRINDDGVLQDNKQYQALLKQRKELDNLEIAFGKLGFSIAEVRAIPAANPTDDNPDGDAHTFGSSPSSIHGSDSVFGQAGTVDSTLNADNIVDKLSMLQNTGSRAESASNMNHLLNWFGGLFNPFIEDIQLHYNANGKYPSAGRLGISQSGTDIWLNAATNLNEQADTTPDDGIPMSGAEILGHEVAHKLTANLIDSGHPLMQEAERLWRIVKDNPQLLSAEDLIPEGVEHTPEMIARAEKTYEYIFTEKTVNKRGIPAIFPSVGDTDTRKRSNHLDEFVAFMITNEQMRKKLTEVDTSNLTDAEGRAKTRIARFLNGIFDFLAKKLGNFRFNENDKNYTRQFDTLMEDLFVAESLAGNRLTSASDYISNGFNTGFDKGLEKSKYAFNTVRKSAVVEKLTGKYGRGLNNTFDFIQEDSEVKDKVLKPYLDGVENYVAGVDMFGIEELLAELRGSTDRNQFASTLLRLRNNYESKERQETMDATLRVLSQPFLDDLGQNEVRISDANKKTLLDFGIRTDMASLLNSDINKRTNESGESTYEFSIRSREDFVNYLNNITSNDAALNAEISRVRSEISALVKDPKLENGFLNMAQSLGHFLVHQSHSEAMGLSSVEAIIKDVHTQADIKPNYDTEILKFHLNTLGSLEALSESSNETISKGMAMLNKQAQKPVEKDGMYRMIMAHKELQDNARNSELFTDELNFVKGYFKEVANDPDISFQVSSLRNDPKLLSRKYKFMGQLEDDPLVQSISSEPRYLYITRYDSSTTTLLQGAISTASRQGGRGQSLVYENNDGAILYDAQQKFNDLERVRNLEIKKMFNRPVSNDKTGKKIYTSSALVKESNGKTELVDVKSQMSWDNKVRFLDTKQDPFEILANTAGNQVSKIRGRKVNQIVVDELLRDYDENRASLPTNAYVWVGAGQKEGTKNEQRWAMLPKETRDYIKQQNADGAEGLYVRKDIANSIFGYRKMSVRNLVDYVHTDPETNKRFKRFAKVIINQQLAGRGLDAFKIAVYTEDTLTDLTSIIKDAVVVKSIVVNMVNMLSNTAQLYANGMTVAEALKLQTEGVLNGVKYSTAHARRKEIRVELATIKKPSAYKDKLVAELAGLDDQLARNPVAFLMDAGAMQTIVEDIEAYTLGDRNLSRKPISKFGNKILDKSPAFLRTGVSQAVMHNDTSFYKWANNAVKLSDFSARYALIKHLEQQHPDMSPEDRINKSMSEFIDYDIPTNKVIQYLNDTGFLWFTKYGLRSTSIAARLAVHHPERIAKIFLLETLFGDISTVMDFNAPGRFGTAGGKFEGAIESIAPLSIADSLLSL